MFTGLIQSLGTVVSASPERLLVDLSLDTSDPLTEGESISVNGVCLTAITTANPIAFDLSEETWRRTALSRLKPGDPVNIERAMQARDRFGGHIVSGHVDTVGELRSVEEREGSWIYQFRAPQEYAHLMVDKGSVAVEGISLTVVGPESGNFEVWIIPHTRAHTNLARLSAGDWVNLEFDIVAKYLAQLSQPYR